MLSSFPVLRKPWNCGADGKFPRIYSGIERDQINYIYVTPYNTVCFEKDTLYPKTCWEAAH